MTCDYRKDGGCVPYVCSKWADSVKGGGKGDKTIPGYASVCWHEGRYPAECARLTNGTAGIGPQARHSQACSHNGGRASAGATGHPVKGHGIPYWTVCRILVGAAHGEFGAVCLAQQDRAGSVKPGDRSRVIRWRIGLENFRCAGGGNSGGRRAILY